MENTHPKREKVYLLGIHHHAFRNGETSEVTGVKMILPILGQEPSLAYEVEFSDGVTDVVPVSEIGSLYKIITFSEIVGGKLNTK